jgi:predicted MFS family arabinose efflux permease
MYTFVFLWTPALSPRGEKLPHGFIFAIFMTASMVGTALAGRLLRSCRLERLMQVCGYQPVVAMRCLCLWIPLQGFRKG